MSPTMIRSHDADTEPVLMIEPDAHATPGTLDRLGAHMTRLMTEEDGMSTAEYAIGTIAAAAFGAILYTVVTDSQDTLSACLLVVSSTAAFLKIVWVKAPESRGNAKTVNDSPGSWDGLS